MPLDAISLALEITGRIEAQTAKLKQNKSKLRQLAIQAVGISNDIREAYAGLDEQNVDLPKNMVDSISELELVLGKVLKAVQKEQKRTQYKAWFKASSQSDKCTALSEELTSCATRFGMAANLYILGQTRMISIKQDQIAARDEELLRLIVIKTMSVQGGRQYNPPAVQTLEMLQPRSSGESSSSSSLEPRAPVSMVSTERDEQNAEDSRGFKGFIECLDQILTPKSEISSPLQEAFAFFFQHVETRHTGLSICYAATETFVLEYSDELKVCACVAVLKEDLDLRPNFNDRAGNVARCRKDFTFDFTLITVTDLHGSPSDWIQVQGLANHFGKERVAYALWDLGRLPSASHAPDSDSFRWIKQSLSTIPTASGQKVVVDVESGNSEHPFRRFHQLNARIAHPSNAAYRSDLLKHLDDEYRLICEESNEEWFIAVIGQVGQILDKTIRCRYLQAHQHYAFRSIQLEIEAFASMGILNPLSVGPQRDGNPLFTFQQLQDDALTAIKFLFDPFIEKYSGVGSKLIPMTLTPEHLSRSRVLGTAWWKIHTSIVLLSSEGREQSSVFTRIPLAKARHDLAQMAAPHPGLIWNYVPAHLTSRAGHKRQQILQSKSH
ncbi:hypothetical protein B0H34DRAFT_719875 [Crassisporium funariophilum]|nr:hypothetical protein B0H34DRAFT_719875 [Crassisporium funariophilum]